MDWNQCFVRLRVFCVTFAFEFLCYEWNEMSICAFELLSYDWNVHFVRLSVFCVTDLNACFVSLRFYVTDWNVLFVRILQTDWNVCECV